MEHKRARDERIAQVARRQHGAISIRQLHAAGLSNSAVRKRCGVGRLHRLHRGVYAVGHIAPSLERQWSAAVLAMTLGADGRDRIAAISHRSAASLWKLLPALDAPVDISLRSRGGRQRRQGLRIHRPTSLSPHEIASRQGIPVTSPARTLADLRSVISGRELRRAIRQADFLGLELGPETDSDGTRSELERRFLRVCRRHQLPNPSVNHRIGAMTVDFCWVGQRLVVETDGYRSHRGREAFEDDRARELRLCSIGYEVLHISYRQVVDEPAWVAAGIRTALGASGRVTDPMEH